MFMCNFQPLWLQVMPLPLLFDVSAPPHQLALTEICLWERQSVAEPQTRASPGAGAHRVPAPAGAFCSPSCCSSQAEMLSSTERNGCPPTASIFISWRCHGLMCLDIHYSSAERKYPCGKRQGSVQGVDQGHWKSWRPLWCPLPPGFLPPTV